jgi:hypothetical protein
MTPIHKTHSHFSLVLNLINTKLTIRRSMRIEFGIYYIPLTLYPRKGSRGISDIPKPTFYQNYLAMRNTADVPDRKPIAVLLQSILGVSAINPLVALYDIHGRKKGAIPLFCPGHH